MIPAVAIITDRVGARRVLLIGSAVVTALGYSFFAMVNSGNRALMVLALVLALAIAHALTYSPSAKCLADLFPANVRYTGTSVTYHLGGALTGGLVPLVAATLVAWAGGTGSLALYIMAGGALSRIAVLFARTGSDPTTAAATTPFVTGHSTVSRTRS
jgi:MFS family permease